MNKHVSGRKYIFVTGGVLSGVGKGITAASIGAILKARGLKISVQKCEAYLNVDAGTLNPAEHGECFVTKDGTEIDLDLGHYERFLDIELTKTSTTLAGRVYRDLIQAEREGKFLGKTVQMIPHFTDAIQREIEVASEGSDVHIVELGGTVGDYESVAYVEAFREFAAKVGRENCIFTHVIYIPYLLTSKELKTKPAQNALRDLRGFGIMPDIIGARADYTITDGALNKISMFGGIAREAVIPLPNARTIYEVPLTLEANNIATLILKKFKLKAKAPDMSNWTQLVERATKKYEQTIKIGIVAKYLDNEDTYFSVVEALHAAAWQEAVNLEIVWVDAEAVERDGTSGFAEYDGILVPGGFGVRGVEGKIAAANFALEHKKPYLGICLGLQVAVIAAARRGGVVGAISEEIQPSAKENVVYLMSSQAGKEATGGTMRLGDYTAELEEASAVAELYKTTEIVERHRHRYEVNRAFEKSINKGGIKVVGESPDGRLVEFVEADNHPYFVATQAHPEFKSRPHRAHSLFVGLVRAALKSV